MSSIVLYPVFYEYKNVQIQDKNQFLSLCLQHLGDKKWYYSKEDNLYYSYILYPLKAVYNTMRILLLQIIQFCTPSPPTTDEQLF